MNKVYVVQAQPGKNIVPARKWGDLIELLPANDQIIISADKAISLIGDKLSRFDDKDYLLLIGDPIAIMAAGVMAAKVNNGKVNTLKWDRQTTSYYVVKLDFSKYEFNFNRRV